MRTFGIRYYLRKPGLIQDTILQFKSRKRRNDFLYGPEGYGFGIVSSNDLSFTQRMNATLMVAA